MKGKKPVGYDVYRDPSYHEYVDQANCSSQKSSKRTCSRLSQTSKKKPSNKFTLQFPNHIILFIDDTVDIKSDGNYGFRVIASLHGYGEDGWSMVHRDLDNEIRSSRSCLYEKLFGSRLSKVRESLFISYLGPHPLEKWMTLLGMGYVIANRYNVILVSLDYPSLTFFPMTISHPPNVSIYCIGFVNMNEGFPLSPIILDWKKYHTLDVTSWMIGFAGSLQHWKHLTPVVSQYVRL
ncbi:uncharacterized protein LOC127095326 [Lathyrus oleraceus]|uniref:uncharacterized protein LOC127095326 n=1 Tax=Pisum sativum TaxID=3888 RepID=UPI0021CE13F9|nr:uncharacterized protein LOC127095326 [Pisum sativum]